MLIGLLLGKFGRQIEEAALPQMPVSRHHPHRSDEVLRAIDETLNAHGDDALTDSERIIWNTTLFLSIFTPSLPNIFANDARVRNWAAARTGLAAMGLPEAADSVVLLVKELAYRAEQPHRGRDADAASLERLAILKRDFRTIEERHVVNTKLEGMIEKIYPWPD